MIINMADLQDPQGRSYRQVNAERQHTIPIGTLVELSNGARAFVVCYGRDCDQTPLYYVSLDSDDTVRRVPGWKNSSWQGGFAEQSLTVVGGG